MIIKNQTRQTRTRIIVIKGKIDSLPLIGRPTLSNLGMVLIDETGNLTRPTAQETNKVKNYCNTTETSRDPQKVRRKIPRYWKGKKRWTRYRNPLTNERERNADSPETKTSTVTFTRAVEERINEFVDIVTL